MNNKYSRIWSEKKTPKYILNQIDYFYNEILYYPLNPIILSYLECKIRDLLEHEKNEENIDDYKINIYNKNKYYPIGVLIIIYIVLNEIKKTYCLIKRKVII